MPEFWAFWIPVNLFFWLYVAATVVNPKRIHFGISVVMWLITGVFPLIIFKMLSE